jgi:hypothetical protein
MVSRKLRSQWIGSLRPPVRLRSDAAVQASAVIQGHFRQWLSPASHGLPAYLPAQAVAAQRVLPHLLELVGQCACTSG